MDIETYLDSFNNIKPYCICLKLEKNFLEFYGQNVVLNFLEGIVLNSKTNNLTIYTHNINFDGLLILDFIKDKNIIFDLFIRDSNIYWISINYLKIKILIRCSYKIINLSVIKIGEILKNKKSVFPYKFINEKNLYYIGDIPNVSYFNSMEDYICFSTNKNSFDVKKDTISYCFKDIEIVYIFLYEILKIIHKHDKKIINNSFSFSSIAYKIYIKLYDKWDINYYKNNKFTHDYVKDSYFGGRCEVFGNPKNKKIHYFDFSGMYSQCMEQKFPIGKGEFKYKNLSIFDIGFHSVKVRCDSYLPYLPFRSNKLIFPNGEFTGRYWYEEILNALKNKNCEILEHYSSYVYEKEDFIFKDYSNYFSELRNKNFYYKIFGKNMNNGLYGSFALNEKDEEYIICYNECELSSYKNYTDILKISKIGNFYILTVKKNEKSKKIIDKKDKWVDFKKRNIAYSSIVAAKARIKLNNALNLVLQDGGELYYTDTDSIFAGYDDNRLGQSLGEIKWTEVHEDGVFISSKFYYLKNLKLKGINDNEANFIDIKKKFYNNEEKLIFNNQLNFEKKKYILKQKYLNKEVLISSYDKRIFSKDKLKTKAVYVYPDL